MTRRRDEVKQCMNTIVSESGITLNARFLCQDVIVLMFKVADDLREANRTLSTPSRIATDITTDLASLSIWSPKPGVSTIVSEMRVPSSSNSSSRMSLMDGYPCIRCVDSDSPTVIGLILTPSSKCAFVGSSSSLPCRTFLPHSVLTKVVRPRLCQLQ